MFENPLHWSTTQTLAVSVVNNSNLGRFIGHNLKFRPFHWGTTQYVALAILAHPGLVPPAARSHLRVQKNHQAVRRRSHVRQRARSANHRPTRGIAGNRVSATQPEKNTLDQPIRYPPAYYNLQHAGRSIPSEAVVCQSNMTALLGKKPPYS